MEEEFSASNISPPPSSIDKGEIIGKHGSINVENESIGIEWDEEEGTSSEIQDIEPNEAGSISYYQMMTGNNVMGETFPQDAKIPFQCHLINHFLCINMQILFRIFAELFKTNNRSTSSLYSFTIFVENNILRLVSKNRNKATEQTFPSLEEYLADYSKTHTKYECIPICYRKTQKVEFAKY